MYNLSHGTNLTHPQPNSYHVQAIEEDYLNYAAHYNHLDSDESGHPFVTFSCADALLSDPLLLSLHAVCARVAHMSGAVEEFDKLESDIEAS